MVCFCRPPVREPAVMRKHRLTLLPGGASGEFPEGTPLIDALSDMGVSPRTPCGGKGICGKCGVQITEGAPVRTAADDRFFPDRPLHRLACRVSIDGDMTVSLPEPVSAPSGGRALPSRLNDPAAAIDIGTTTVQISIVDRNGGETYPSGRSSIPSVATATTSLPVLRPPPIRWCTRRWCASFDAVVSAVQTASTGEQPTRNRQVSLWFRGIRP
jgi:ferredoxin